MNYSIKNIVFLSLVFCMFSLASFGQEKSGDDVDFRPFLENEAGYYLNRHSKLFEKSDVASPYIDIESSDYFKIYSQNENWYKVRLIANKNDVVSTGYVKKNDVRLMGIYSGDMNSVYYDFLRADSDNEILFYIKKYQEQEKIDTLSLTNLYHGFRVEEMGYTALENGMYIISFQTYRESCPGLTSDDLILTTEDQKLVHLINSTSTGEAGWSEIEEVYLPVSFENGTIKLVLNGDKKNMISWETGDIMEIENPAQYGIPLEQLVIKKITATEPLFDDEDNEVLDDSGEPKIIETINKTIIYQWDGTTLNPVQIISE